MALPTFSIEQQRAIAQKKLTDEEYQAHVEAIQKAKTSGTTPKPLGRITASSGISASDLKQALSNLESMWANDDVLDIFVLAGELKKKRLGPANIVGRLAYASASIGFLTEAFELAQEGYKLAPAEPGSYLAMALCKLTSEQPKEALRWLQLADLCSDKLPHSFTQTREDLLDQIKNLDDQLSYTLPYVLKPELSAALRACTFLEPLIDFDEMDQALERIRAAPDTFEREVEDSPLLHGVIRELYRDPGNIFIRDFSDGGDKYKQPECPIHRLSFDVFLKLAWWLPAAELGEMRKSCRLFEYWGENPVTWEMVYTRLLDPLPEEDWGVKRMPSYWKAACIQRHSCFTRSNSLSRIWEQDGFLDFFEKSRTLLVAAAHRYREFSSRSISNATDLFESLMQVLVLGGPKTAAVFAESNTLGIAALYLGSLHDSPLPTEIISAVKWLIALICTNGLPTVNKLHEFSTILTLCFSQIGGPAHLEVNALAASVKAVSSIHALRPAVVIPNEVSVYERNPEKFAQRLNGTWHHFMFFCNPDIEYHQEQGIFNMAYEHETKTLTGEGADSLGSFVMEDGTFDQPNGFVNFRRSYKDEFNLVFEGTMTQFGMGGAFAVEGASADNQWFGHWFAVRSTLLDDSDGLDVGADGKFIETPHKIGERGYCRTFSGPVWEDKIAQILDEHSKREEKRPWEVEPSHEAQLMMRCRFFGRNMTKCLNFRIRRSELTEMIGDLGYDENQRLQDYNPELWYRAPYESEEVWLNRFLVWKIAATKCNLTRSMICSLFSQEIEDDLPILAGIPEMGELTPLQQKVSHKWFMRLGFSVLFFHSPGPHDLHGILQRILQRTITNEIPDEDDNIQAENPEDATLSNDFVGSVRRRHKTPASSFGSGWIIAAAAAATVTIIGAFAIGTFLGRTRPKK